MKMIEPKKDELLAAPADVWFRASYEVNHRKWSLLWCRFGDGSGFCFSFISPMGQMYSFYTDYTENSGNRGKVFFASPMGQMYPFYVDYTEGGNRNVVSYYASLGDKPERMDAVLRLIPTHVIDRLLVLLDAIR